MGLYTEFIDFQLKQKGDLGDIFSNEGQGWITILLKILNLPGCEAVHWSHHVEDPDWVVVKVDWNTEEGDTASTRDSQLRELVAPIADESQLIGDTATYQPYKPSYVAESAPFTELLSFMVPSGTSEQAIQDFEDAGSNVTLILTASKDGAKVVTSGWIDGEIDHAMSPTGKAKVLRYLVAWPSLEAHSATLELPEFLSALAQIQAKCLPPTTTNGMFHAQFQDARVTTSTHHSTVSSPILNSEEL